MWQGILLQQDLSDKSLVLAQKSCVPKSAGKKEFEAHH
jgi:hypothetical protein